MLQPSSALRQACLVLLGAVFAAALGEGFTRMAVGSRLPSVFSDPASYADPLCDDAYWAMVDQQDPGAPLTRDPVLGWRIDSSSQNPVGAWRSPRLRSADAPIVALFGDSFVQGTTPDGQRLPDQLQDLLPERQVLNFGVGGYGLDQIVLHLEKHRAILAHSEVLLGIMLTDIDRSVLRLRSAPKPWFSIEAGALVLHSPDEDITESVRPRSLFWAWLGRGPWRQLSAQADEDCQVMQKTALTTALIRRAAETCETVSAHCQVLLFPHPEALGATTDWRSQAISNAAMSAGLNVIDAGQAWIDDGLDLSTAFGSARHPSARANTALARALAPRFKTAAALSRPQAE
jgi:hypothetical protein